MRQEMRDYLDAPVDRHGTNCEKWDLLGKHYLKQGMGKGHRGKGQAKITRCLDPFVEPPGGTDEKYHRIFSASCHPIKKRSQRLGGHFLSLNAKGDLITFGKLRACQLFLENFRFLFQSQSDLVSRKLSSRCFPRL